MSHPYLDQPITGVHDQPEDYDEEREVMRTQLFRCISPKGTRVWSPDVHLLNQVRAALWPPSHKNKPPRRAIEAVKRG